TSADRIYSPSPNIHGGIQKRISVWITIHIHRRNPSLLVSEPVFNDFIFDKMKNLNIHINKALFFIVGLSLFFTGCEKSLLESPKQISEENFYTTPSEVEAAVNAIYTPLRADLMSNY